MAEKKIRLKPSETEDDGSGFEVLMEVYDYDKDPNGADILCGICGETIYPDHPVNLEETIYVDAINCPSCGGRNVFDSSTFK